MPAEPISFGPCFRELIWMQEEGFFSENPQIACSTWIFRASENTLQRLIDLLDSETQNPEVTELATDVVLSILSIEAIKRGKNREEFEFTEEELAKWMEIYSISAAMEISRRNGILEIQTEKAPLVEVKWKYIDSKA